MATRKVRAVEALVLSSDLTRVPGAASCTIVSVVFPDAPVTLWPVQDALTTNGDPFVAKPATQAAPAQIPLGPLSLRRLVDPECDCLSPVFVEFDIEVRACRMDHTLLVA